MTSKTSLTIRAVVVVLLLTTGCALVRFATCPVPPDPKTLLDGIEGNECPFDAGQPDYSLVTAP